MINILKETKLRINIALFGMLLILLSIYLSGEWQFFFQDSCSPIGDWRNSHFGFWGWSDVFLFFGVGFIVITTIYWSFVRGYKNE